MSSDFQDSSVRAMHAARSRSRRAIVALGVAVIFAAAPVAAATDSNQQDAGDKALRGLANILTGVMAFPGEIYKHWTADGPGMGLMVGIPMGASMIVGRMLVGFGELLTSPAPWPRKDFGPLIEPPYTWNYFKE
jgi:putative exosortase-associated protein (TIGR04073 family)